MQINYSTNVVLPAGLGRSALPSWFLDQLDFPLFRSLSGEVEAELLHTYSRIDPYDTLILCVRVAVLTAVTLTVPIVLFPVSTILAPSIYTLAGCKIQWNSWTVGIFFFTMIRCGEQSSRWCFPTRPSTGPVTSPLPSFCSLSSTCWSFLPPIFWESLGSLVG